MGGVPSMVMSNPTGTTIQPVQGMGGWGPAAGVAGAGALAAGVYDPNKHYSVTSTAPSYGGTGPGALALSPQNTGSPGGAFAPNGQQQSNMDYGQQQAQQPQQQFDYSQQQQGYNYGQQQQYAQQQQPQQQQQFAGGSASAEQAPGGYYAYDQGQQPQPQQAQGGQGQWTLGGQTYQQQ